MLTISTILVFVKKTNMNNNECRHLGYACVIVSSIIQIKSDIYLVIIKYSVNSANSHVILILASLSKLEYIINQWFLIFFMPRPKFEKYLNVATSKKIQILVEPQSMVKKQIGNAKFPAIQLFLCLNCLMTGGFLIYKTGKYRRKTKYFDLENA